jgi:phosphate transport system ATP-binding protein
VSAVTTEKLSLTYGSFQALQDVSLEIPEHKITAIIGPSGCGKSTFLRCLNRMNDEIDEVRITGKIMVLGMDLYANGVDLRMLRKRVGMVFQRPNPFPLSVYRNVSFGPEVHGCQDRRALDALVEESLRAVHLWDSLKDDLSRSALELSGEEQQRLCIARLLAAHSEVLLMDEPCSALDPIATQKVEELLIELKERYTIVIVTHNMAQAARVSDHTGLFYLGRLIEFDRTEKIFTSPARQETEAYVTGRFG